MLCSVLLIYVPKLYFFISPFSNSKAQCCVISPSLYNYRPPMLGVKNNCYRCLLICPAVSPRDGPVMAPSA